MVDTERPETTASTEIGSETPRFRWRVRLVGSLVVCVLLIGDVVMYSLYRALQSRVDYQETRIERLDKMVTDMLAVSENAAKIEGIETQVDKIDGQISGLADALKEKQKTEEKPKKRRSRR